MDEPKVDLHQLFCGICGDRFFVCVQDFRGQSYCGPGCRRQGRLRARRAANARHQRSAEGRLDHRDRQRAYMARASPLGETTSVTDTGSEKLASLAPCASPRGPIAFTVQAFATGGQGHDHEW